MNDFIEYVSHSVLYFNPQMVKCTSKRTRKYNYLIQISIITQYDCFSAREKRQPGHSAY